MDLFDPQSRSLNARWFLGSISALFVENIFLVQNKFINQALKYCKQALKWFGDCDLTVGQASERLNHFLFESSGKGRASEEKREQKY